MKYLQVKDGISVRKDSIIMIERIESGGTRITTEDISIESIFPYETILMLLENDAIEENLKVNNPRELSNGNNFWGSQHWAG